MPRKPTIQQLKILRDHALFAKYYAQKYRLLCEHYGLKLTYESENAAEYFEDMEKEHDKKLKKELNKLRKKFTGGHNAKA